nr:MAG TPA: hypothetical protein [Bacteriophage sp.]
MRFSHFCKKRISCLFTITSKCDIFEKATNQKF